MSSLSLSQNSYSTAGVRQDVFWRKLSGELHSQVHYERCDHEQIDTETEDWPLCQLPAACLVAVSCPGAQSV